MAVWAVASCLLGVAGGSHVPAVARADEPSKPWRGASVASAEVSDSDSDLGSPASEVVVLTEGESPRVTKLRARSQADARTLARELDARPGVVAEVNATVSLDPVVATSGGRTGSSVPIVSARSTASGTLTDEQFGAQLWGMKAVGADAAWRVTRGRGVVVAVVDSGVDATHPDLTARARPQINLVKDGRAGDPNGHGTHVAGIVAASLDGAGVAGLAHEVSVLPVRVLDASGTGDWYTIAQGIIAARQAGATVINLSLAGGRSSIIEEVIADTVNAGVSVVAAVGNSFQSGNPVLYPAALPNVLGVSSIDSNGRSSAFAEVGSQVDLSAPGEKIYSTIPGGWGSKSGTSMATPFVAATVALVRAANPTLTRAQVESVLISTAADDTSTKGWDAHFGHGVVRADRAALRAAGMPGGIQYKGAALAPMAASPVPSGVRITAVTTTAPTVARATLTWHPPTDAGSPITGYLVRVDQTGARVRVTSRSAVISGLRPGSAYTFSVAAQRVSGYTPWSSPSARISPPHARASVALAATAKKSKLRVDVNPNMGKGSFKFTVQKLNKVTWVNRSTYKTKTSAETRTINLKKGTYRVVVHGKYGYGGVVSRAVTLKR